MQVKEIKQDGLSHELEITIKAADIDKRTDARLVEVGKTVKVQGFRPGKVPLKILKQKYGKAIMGEILEAAVNESSAKVMKDKKIKPAMQPKIEVKSFDDGKDLVYSMAVDTLPAIKIADLKGVKLTKMVAKVDEAAVDDALKRLAENSKSTKKIETKRAAKNGDTVLIDFDGRTADDDVKQPGMAAEGHRLELGSGQFIAGFEEQLVGQKAGAALDVKVSFPENYGAPDLAGREAIFEVTIHEIHEPSDAEINDDFAKNFGMDDLGALKDAIKGQLETEYEQQSRMVLKKELLDYLDSAHDFEIPSGMLETEHQNILDQIKLDRQRQGEKGELSDKEAAEFKDIAERRVRLGLVLSEIGQENKLSVSDPELQKSVITEAQKYPGQEKQVFDYYSKNPQALESLRAPLFEEKVVDFVLELASVSEKSVSAEVLANALDDEGDHAHDCGDDSCSHSSHKEKKPATKKKAASAKKAAPKKAAAKKPAAKKAPAKKSSAKKKAS